jgi:hypothetical protein
VSRTCTVEFGGSGFWALSDSVSVLLAQAAVAAEEMSMDRRPAGFEDVLYQVKVSAIVTDFGFLIDEDWRGERLDLLVSLIEEAARRLVIRERIRDFEVAGWMTLDGQVAELRSEVVETAPVVELAEGMLALFEDRLPTAPAGTWWLYGVEGGRRTIAVRDP